MLLLLPLLLGTTPVPRPGVVADGDGLAVTPPTVRVATGTTVLQVRLGADAPSPVEVSTVARAAAVATDGTVTASDQRLGWATTARDVVVLRPGDALDVPVRIAAPPPDGVGVVVVRARPVDEPATGLTVPAGPVTTVASTLLADGQDGAPTVALGRDGDVATVAVTAPRPTLVAVSLASRGTRQAVADRVVVPGAPLELALPLPSGPWPVEVAVTDDDGRTVRARLPLAREAVVGLAAAALALAVVLLLLVRRLRRVRA